MSNRLGALAQTGARLTAVAARVEHGCLDGLRFEFSDVRVVLAVDPDTDEIRVSDVLDTARERTDGTEWRDMSSEPPWSRSIGRELGWVWFLRNNRGYDDGVQLEFDDDTRSELVVQWIAIASAIVVHEVRRIAPGEGT
jgi:hypothetical protein